MLHIGIHDTTTCPFCHVAASTIRNDAGDLDKMGRYCFCDNCQRAWVRWRRADREVTNA